MTSLLYICRPRPKKLTNSEKTTTTNNLSQHKYLRIRRQLRQETENQFLAITHNDVDVEQVSSRGVAAGVECYDRQRAAPSVPLKYVLRKSNWHTLCHHYQQQSVSQSCQSIKMDKAATETEASHLRKSELSKLLTSIQLTPQVIENQQSNALSNLHHHQISPTSISGDKDSLCQSEDIQIPNFNSCTLKKCSSQCPPTALSESLVVSVLNMQSSGMDFQSGITAPNTHPRRNSWYDEYLRATLYRLYARKERNKATSAPGSMCKSLPKMQKYKTSTMIRPESSPITIYLSSDTGENLRDIKKQPTKHVENLSELRAEKAREVFNKPPPLFIDARPRSHWYEMRTPKFHIEARRNNNFIRKSCTY